MRDPLGIETAGHVEHDVAELVGNGEPLPLAPVLGVHHDATDGRQSPPARPGGEAAHGVERQGEYLDAPFFEQLHQGGGPVAQAPVAAQRVGDAGRLDGIVPHGSRGWSHRALDRPRMSSTVRYEHPPRTFSRPRTHTRPQAPGLVLVHKWTFYQFAPMPLKTPSNRVAPDGMLLTVSLPARCSQR